MWTQFNSEYKRYCEIINLKDTASEEEQQEGKRNSVDRDGNKMNIAYFQIIVVFM
jgi:hypothetical protein